MITATAKKGNLANVEQITLMALRLLYRRTNQMDSSWKTFVNVGNAANKPIWKLDAPINKAIATKKAPLVNAVIASVVNPS